MKQPWPVVICGLLLILAVVLEQTAMPRMSLLGSRPDLVLTVSFVVALLSRQAGGAVAGFSGAVLYSALAGANLVHHVFSRTIIAYVLALLGENNDVSARMAGLMVAAATLASRVILMFSAPPPAIGEYLQATILAAVYNGVVAWPVYSWLRRWFRPSSV